MNNILRFLRELFYFPDFKISPRYHGTNILILGLTFDISSSSAADKAFK